MFVAPGKVFLQRTIEEDDNINNHHRRRRHHHSHHVNLVTLLSILVHEQFPYTSVSVLGALCYHNCSSFYYFCNNMAYIMDVSALQNDATAKAPEKLSFLK